MSKIAIAVPNQFWIHKVVVDRIFEIIAKNKDKHTIYFQDPCRKCNENNYQLILHRFLESDAEYLLQIDDDNPPMRDPLELVEADKDIVSLPTPVWVFDYNSKFDIRPLQWNVYNYVKETGQYRTVEPKRGWERVDAAGAGCVLIARRVLEAPEMQRAAWHRRWNKKTGIADRGLDLAFCERARKCGFEIWTNWDYPCHHFKELDGLDIYYGFQSWLNAILDANGGKLERGYDDKAPPRREIALPTALVFPIWCPSEEIFTKVKFHYERTRDARGITKIFVVDDGCISESAVKYFNDEAEADRCVYVKFLEQTGLTRSWNAGAEIALRAGAEVVVFSNQDAHPAHHDDLAALIADCAVTKGRYFAVGPQTNAPGHQPLQVGFSRAQIIEPVEYLNGFTWAAHRENILQVYEKRRAFLIDDETKKFDFAKKEVVDWEGPGRESLAMVGQEDEIFEYARRELGLGCAITRASFFHHDKLSLFRAAVPDEIACSAG